MARTLYKEGACHDFLPRHVSRHPQESFLHPNWFCGAREENGRVVLLSDGKTGN